MPTRTVEIAMNVGNNNGCSNEEDNDTQCKFQSSCVDTYTLAKTNTIDRCVGVYSCARRTIER